MFVSDEKFGKRIRTLRVKNQDQRIKVKGKIHPIYSFTLESWFLVPGSQFSI